MKAGDIVEQAHENAQAPWNQPAVVWPLPC